MVVVVFRSRLCPGVEEEITAMSERLYGLASAMPGFISYREYAAEDGEAVVIVEFESHAALQAWRDHPEHVAARKAGRERLFSEFRITVCDAVRDYAFGPGTA